MYLPDFAVESWRGEMLTSSPLLSPSTPPTPPASPVPALCPSPASQPLKRKADDDIGIIPKKVCLEATVRPRLPLGPVDANIALRLMSSPKCSKLPSLPDAPRRSPRKRHGGYSEEKVAPEIADTGSHSRDGDQHDVSLDDEATPKGRRTMMPYRDHSERQETSPTRSSGARGVGGSMSWAAALDKAAALRGISQPPDLRAPSVSGSSTTSRSSKRSRSPVKNVGDLRFASIERRTFNDPLPDSPEILELLDDIVAAASGSQVIPAAVSHDISPRFNVAERVLPHHITHHYHLSDADAAAQLRELRDIVAQAADCQLESQSEAAWNARVHDRLLRHALAGTRTRPWIITTAPIISSLVPRATAGSQLPSRLVDLCITVEPDPAQGDAITRLLSGEPEALRSLNQSMHHPIRFRPLAIAIETKLETSSDTGESQLAIWTKAWFNRIGLFLGPERSRCPGPTLPLVRIVGHSWFLLLAWEEEGKASAASVLTVERPSPSPTSREPAALPEARTPQERTLVMVSELPLGDTRSLIGVYKLLKVIRLLSEWADGPFRTWFEREVLSIQMS